MLTCLYMLSMVGTKASFSFWKKIKSNFIVGPCLMESIKCHHNEIANYIKNQMEENEINKSLFFFMFTIPQFC